MNESVVAAGRSKESAGAPAWFPMGSPELAVVIPTFKESENIGPLLSRLQGLLAGLHYEVIFVDDHSPDGTAAIVRQGEEATRESAACCGSAGAGSQVP